ncbi:urease accessory protein UreD [Alphaproteobacteria bacterium LSUCC0684]
MPGSADLHHEEIALERAHGKVNLTLKDAALQRLFQSGSAKAFLPVTYGKATEVVLANTAGGLADGDIFSYEICAEANSRIAATTQAAERVYQALGGGMAEARLTIKATGRSDVFWLPHETILYDRSRFCRRIDVHLDASSKVVLGEIVVFGRKASGEVMTAGHIEDHWRVHRDGQLVHAEAFRLAGDVRAILAHAAGANQAGVMATLLMIAPEELHPLAATLRNIESTDGAWVGVSSWDGKLVVRLVAPELFSIKPTIATILERMTSLPLPRAWAL